MDMPDLADLLTQHLHAPGTFATGVPLPATALSRIAHALLFDYVLVTRDGNHHWRITELEFYMHDPTSHPDPFCHRDPSMVHPARWYVHRAGGSRKGLDVTCGHAGVHGGILIRGLDATRGPSKCVDQVMAALGVTTARDLQARAGDFALVPRASVLGARAPALPGVRERVYVAPRVGLAPTPHGRAGRGHRPAMPALHTQLQYVFAPYRYMVEAWRAPQKHMAAMGALEHQVGAGVLRTVRDELQLAAATVRAWEREQEVGRRVADPKSLVAGGKLGSSSGAAWMRLYGWYVANHDDRGQDGHLESDLSDLSDLGED